MTVPVSGSPVPGSPVPGSFDYSAFTTAAPKKLVIAYRHSCEVRGYDDEHGFDEQKASPAKRGALSKTCVIVLAVCCGIAGLFFVLFGVAFMTTPAEDVTSPISQVIVGAIFLAISFVLIMTARSMTTYATWVVRYRLSWFARANGLSYAFRSDPRSFPGITPDRPGYPYVSSVKLTNVLRTTTGPQVAMGHQDVTYRDSRDRAWNSKGYGIVSDDWNFVAINFSTRSPWMHLKHRRSPQHDAPDQLQANFTLADKTREDEAHAFFTPDLLSVILQTAPGYDAMVHNGWLYLLKGSLYEESTHAEGIAERLEIVQRLVPMVVKQ
ncbi:hypothetical protein GCM10011575_09970 [Microlunatus endophyticus]|uniref:DUF3137 domain-containing protein n=1 Tax=Microlunatus endophyticus TaxID=1716077 RepID=A0A917W241_9ACTN|nr:hypothetical protein [Microlunatus endophyticus]GGL53548.1 hypothetical protein GCM10011575_09970 [Microlunatus endophyticus]